MKVNILIDNENDILNGYLNIDPYADPNDANRIKGNVSNLDEFCDDGELEELIANEILDYYPGKIVDSILTNWLKKLAIGGKITISVADILEISRAVCYHNLTIDQTNELVHGEQKKDWQFKKSTYTLNQLVDVLTNLGLKILKKRVVNYKAIVTAERIK